MITKKQVKCMIDIINNTIKKFNESLDCLYYESNKKRIVATDSKILITLNVNFGDEDFYIHIQSLKKVYKNFWKNSIGAELKTQNEEVLVEYITETWKEKTKLLIENLKNNIENDDAIGSKYPTVDLDKIISDTKERHGELYTSKHLLLFHKIMLYLDIAKFESRSNCLLAQKENITLISRHSLVSYD